MANAMTTRVAAIVRDAGGKIVGRTRLQKTAYILFVAGLEDEIQFIYKHYGPYSEDLATAARHAHLLGQMREVCQQASWGGTYSIYEVNTPSDGAGIAPERLKLAQMAAQADAIELELAATAIFLAKEGYADPWGETARRKPEKVDCGRLDGAQRLYERLKSINVPKPWPELSTNALVNS